MGVSALFLLVQEFDECQLLVGILKERVYLKNWARIEESSFKKLLWGCRRQKGKEANISNLSSLLFIWIAKGKGDRSRRGENTYAASGRREVLQKDTFKGKLFDIFYL